MALMWKIIRLLRWRGLDLSGLLRRLWIKMGNWKLGLSRKYHYLRLISTCRLIREGDWSWKINRKVICLSYELGKLVQLQYEYDAISPTTNLSQMYTYNKNSRYHHQPNNGYSQAQPTRTQSTHPQAPPSPAILQLQITLSNPSF